MLKRKRVFRFIFLFLLVGGNVFSQNKFKTNNDRIKDLSLKLDSLSMSVSGLTQFVDFDVSAVELPSFVRAIGKSRKVNLSITSDLQNITLTHNFSNATIKDVLLYLCKEYNLTFEITGNIISLKRYIFLRKEKKKKIKEISVNYHDKKISLDLQKDTLYSVFKKITKVTGINLVFSPGLENKLISGYIQKKSFDSAMDKLAFSNNLQVTKTKDDYYLFESDHNAFNNLESRVSRNQSQRPARYRNSNFFFKVIDSEKKLLEVDFENTSISSIIRDIGYELKVNMFTNSSLEKLGTASVKSNKISYNDLLIKLLQNTSYTFKIEDGIYFFGSQDHKNLRSSVVVPLMHRSIEIMNQSSSGGSKYSSDVSNSNGLNYNNNRGERSDLTTGNTINNSFDTSNQFFSNYQSSSDALLSLFPSDVIKGLEIKTDVEHNSFVVTGDAQKVEGFKKFLKKIDKPVPVVLIEIIIMEVNKTAQVSTGIDLSIGDKSVNNYGKVYPYSDLTVGAKTINRVIGDFNGFGALNIGKVVPNFFGRIQMMEENGFLKIRSTPKLSTLNGHRASLSNGQRLYYKIERSDIIGAQNPQTVKTQTYVPVNADLSIAIRPIVSGDEQITLSVNVLQSTFNGERIDSSAPPGINSRQFTSTIRVKDQDVIILGGLEENVKNDSGKGIPFLARIPILKWLFSNKTRKDSKTKLSILIKPTIIR